MGSGAQQSCPTYDSYQNFVTNSQLHLDDGTKDSFVEWLNFTGAKVFLGGLGIPKITNPAMNVLCSTDLEYLLYSVVQHAASLKSKNGGGYWLDVMVR